MVCSIDEISLGSKGWDRRHRKREKRMADAYVQASIEQFKKSRFIYQAHSNFVPLAAGAKSVEVHGRERARTPSGGGRNGVPNDSHSALFVPRYWMLWVFSPCMPMADEKKVWSGYTEQPKEELAAPNSYRSQTST